MRESVVIDWQELKKRLMVPVRDFDDVRLTNGLARHGILFVGQIYLEKERAPHSPVGLKTVDQIGKRTSNIAMISLKDLGLRPALPDAEKITIPDQGLADHFQFPSVTRNWDPNARPPQGYTKDKDGYFVPRPRTVEAYFTSDVFKEEQAKFERFLEEHRDYFMEVAVLESDKVVPASHHLDPVQQWIAEKLPNNLKQGLAPEFLQAVLASPEVRESVQEAVAKVVARNLGVGGSS